ncbi:hypothetical protein IQ278_31280 [Tolypothrix sp. LEGE 11397]|uniref:hypothetical protein n=1 Tax=Tolypothrix sp. LEGE 11397 TaxID=2777971 RepID=UPI00188138B0|nr:hypothetical protein [Tolypothrix sp. LEGE 11397]MBE9086526.1 hypothetical protein [Tolypothrix sp. LEGE 11397]UYD29305.1 hypothetical protein HGR01_15435 [Tolypothrix sp. PCC 7712]UYD34787.1 hypothetical protein HG267_02905 [Tolypothrix sp. PCC 7601]
MRRFLKNRRILALYHQRVRLFNCCSGQMVNASSLTCLQRLEAIVVAELSVSALGLFSCELRV